MPRIWADERAVRQVTLNLLSNAIKFTPQGGAITIKVGWTRKGGQYLAIADTGPGIPPEEIPIVLSSFGRGTLAQKNAEEGTGLGLPIVKGLVELHGGEFRLNSTLRDRNRSDRHFPARTGDGHAAGAECRNRSPRRLSAAGAACAAASATTRLNATRGERRVAIVATSFPETALHATRISRKLPLENLAVGVARQRAFEATERLRDLVVGEDVGAVALKLGFFDGVTEHDEGMDALAKHRAGLRHDRDLDDRWMFEQNVLDLGGDRS